MNYRYYALMAVSTFAYEAVQMWRSIATGVEVSFSVTDMRALWWSGEAETTFPGLFGDPAYTKVDKINFWRPLSQRGASGTVLQEVIERASENGLYFARAILNDAGWHSVVRCVANRILPLDDIYFPQLGRFYDREKFLLESRNITYTGPLFM